MKMAACDEARKMVATNLACSDSLPKWPSKPLTITGLHKLLRNPYYKGEIRYRDITYPGLHEPLVDSQTWQQVQDLLSAHNLAGTHQRTNNHYLRGSVFCGSCGSRLMVTTARNRWGSSYLYLICSGRARKITDCQRQAMSAETIEELIEDEYRTIALSPSLQDRSRSLSWKILMPSKQVPQPSENGWIVSALS